MKNILVVLTVVLLLTDDVYCQHLEALMLGKGIKLLSRTKWKSMDKKALAYGVGAVKKAVKGSVAGVVGKPVKLIGVALGPLGLPIKVIGSALTAKSVLEKIGAGVLTVKKLSRDSIRYG